SPPAAGRSRRIGPVPIRTAGSRPGRRPRRRPTRPGEVRRRPRAGPARTQTRPVRGADACERLSPCLRRWVYTLTTPVRDQRFTWEGLTVPDIARAFWVRSPGEGEIRTAELSEPGPDDVLVRTTWSGISRGTESLVFRGGVPETQHRTMRAPYQEGDFPGPVKYGYLNVGVVESGPAELS